MVGEDISLHGTSARRACSLQTGPGGPFVRIADAQPGDGNDAHGHMKQGADILRSIEGDPPDADTLGARGKPEVLDRQARAVQVGVADRVTAQNFASATVAIAADPDARRAFPYAFALPPQVLANS